MIHNKTKIITITIILILITLTGTIAFLSLDKKTEINQLKGKISLFNAGNRTTIALEKNGGEGGDSVLFYDTNNEVTYLDNSYTIPVTEETRLDIPTREGYLFRGYTIHNDEDDTDYVINEIGKVDLSRIDSFGKLYARWEEVKTVELAKNGGNGGIDALYVSKEKSYSIYIKDTTDDTIIETDKLESKYTPIRSGYKFKGYYYGDNCIINEEGKMEGFERLCGENTPSRLEAKWEELPVTLKLSETSGIGYVGGSELTVTIIGENCGKFDLSLSNPEITAKVDIDGNILKIKPRKEGEIKITVTAETDKNKTATYTLQVKEVTLGLSETSGTGYVGGSNLTATITGENCGRLDVENKNTNVAIASISGKTLTITPRAEGSTTIKVKERNANKEATYTLKVEDLTKGYQTIILDKNEGTGGTDKLYYTSPSELYTNPECTSPMTTITVPTRTGYNFKGYYYTYNGTDYAIFSSSGNYAGTNGFASYLFGYIGGNITLTAKWEKETGDTYHEIILNRNGGTGGPDKIYCKCNQYGQLMGFYTDSECESEIKTITVPTKPGYIFIGYYYTNTNNGRNDAIIVGNGSFAGKTYLEGIEGNIALTAKWEKEEDTSISLNPTSGDVKEGGSITSTISGTNMGELTATSDDEEIATASIKENTLTVNGIKEGTATITVEEGNGKKTATFKVTVSR